jgi:hypothetical protein
MTIESSQEVVRLVKATAKTVTLINHPLSKTEILFGSLVTLPVGRLTYCQLGVVAVPLGSE